MCAGCAMVAASAASGARSYLAPRLKPRHVKIATIALIVAALVGSTVAFSGSTAAPAHGASAPAAAGR